MIDYEQIGRRISEQRKHIRRVTQETMAADLGMYQADISNLEKAKKGSGIHDLDKLEMIAEYLGLPVEELIFGSRGTQRPKYPGKAMELRRSEEAVPVAHRRILARLTGQEEQAVRSQMLVCGPYTVHCLTEVQTILGGRGAGPGAMRPTFSSMRVLHLYTFLGDSVAATLTAPVTSVMQHVYQPDLEQLQRLIPTNVLDVTDVFRTLDPYWALFHFDDDGGDRYRHAMLTRMDELRRHADMPVLYITSVYVRDDCRRGGLFRMLIDALKLLFGECVMWLNMEPTEGEELSAEYTVEPCYTVAEVGQMELNAAIAERVGFTIDPDTWHRQAATVDEHGHRQVRPVLVRKCAYLLPRCIRDILRNDGDLVALGRARQALEQREMRPGDIGNEL